MDLYFKKSVFLLCLLSLFSCKFPSGNENSMVLIKTSLGDMKIKLYDSTPVHRDNFIHLVNSHFYDGISFHRVIKNFMIQAGDPQTKSGPSKNLPDSLNSYTIPAEFNKLYFHKKGALAAARTGDDVNPQRRSSGTQFYIVQGEKLSDDQLNQLELRINSMMKQDKFNSFVKATSDSVRMSGKEVTDAEINQLASIKMFQYLSSYKDFRLSEEQRNIYKTLGGTPRLDGSYTVFGEVVEGLDIIDKIADVPTDSTDKPITDIKILKIKIIKN